MRLTSERNAAALVVVVGAVGQILDKYAAGSIAASYAHASFGPLLCAAIMFRFRFSPRRSPIFGLAFAGAVGAKHKLIRRTSHEIYILLFALYTLRQMLNFGTHLALGVPVTHEINSLYFVCGLYGLMTLHLMAAASAAFAPRFASADSVT